MIRLLSQETRSKWAHHLVYSANKSYHQGNKCFTSVYSSTFNCWPSFSAQQLHKKKTVQSLKGKCLLLGCWRGRGKKNLLLIPKQTTPHHLICTFLNIHRITIFYQKETRLMLYCFPGAQPCLKLRAI